MDKRKDDRRLQEIEEKIAEFSSIKKDVEEIAKERGMIPSEKIDFSTYRQELKASTEETLAAFDDVINSWWTWGDTKTLYKLLRAYIVREERLKENVISLWEYIFNLREAIFMLAINSDTLKVSVLKLDSSKETVDIKDLKAKIDGFLDNPAVHEIGKILENIPKMVENKNKSDKAEKEYLR